MDQIAAGSASGVSCWSPCCVVGAPLPDQIRARLAIVATHMSVTLLEAAVATPEELQAAAREVALDLLSSP